MKLKAVTPLAGVGTEITDAVRFLQLEQKPFEKSKMHQVVAKTLYSHTPRPIFSEIWRRSTKASRIKQKSKLWSGLVFLKNKIKM